MKHGVFLCISQTLRRPFVVRHPTTVRVQRLATPCFFVGNRTCTSHARKKRILVSCERRGGSSDSDDFELDVSYDSDDYDSDDFGPVVTEQRGEEGQEKLVQVATTRDGHKERESSLLSLLLLVGAATDRFVTNAQAYLAASFRFAFLCLSESFAPLRSKYDRMMAKFRLSPVGKKLNQIKRQTGEIQKELPDDLWGKLLWLWDRPPVQRMRLTFSMVNLSFRLPALVALIVTQGSLLASQVSLPMLAPLLLGTGMMMRSIRSNASFLFPRIGLLVVLLWILWFTNSVIQNTVQYLKKQRAIDDRLAGGIITVTEVSTLLVALVVLLSMIGVNVSALLLPAGIAVAVAAKDLSHNFLAGFFLFVVQPFKLGDRVAVSSSAPSQGPGPLGAPPGWFEGVCEKVDLRYTVVRQGRRKLMVPNSTFLTREFMVLDDSTPSTEVASVQGGEDEQVEFLTNDNRHVWQYLHGPPVHQELAQQAVPPGATPVPPGATPIPPGPSSHPPGPRPMPSPSNGFPSNGNANIQEYRQHNREGMQNSANYYPVNTYGGMNYQQPNAGYWNNHNGVQ